LRTVGDVVAIHFGTNQNSPWYSIVLATEMVNGTCTNHMGDHMMDTSLEERLFIVDALAAQIRYDLVGHGPTQNEKRLECLATARRIVEILQVEKPAS
jgi:hypothetical protein